MQQINKKLRPIGFMIVIFVVIAALLSVNHFYIKPLNDMTELVVVKSEGLDIQKPLEDQSHLLGLEEFKTSEVKLMDGEYVTSIEQMKGKKLNRIVEVGLPIPLDAMEEIK
ncbi:hypothetical protein [Peribacillus alkalitolerans]|uniref:hypothetical protein n=1 Tax=Peribacillus alkalitolerans TaxID=1550385 RepID=UPI0013D5E9B0|nr:hypothetical protein [Peribacillus alkalitolerans]